MAAPMWARYGRILRGRKPTDFFTLTDLPERQLVMVMDRDGLAQLDGKTGWQCLQLIGYRMEYIVHKLLAGYQFKLALFDLLPLQSPATWEVVAAAVNSVYPAVSAAMAQYLPTLRCTSFASWQEQSGFDWSVIDETGLADPRYMTLKRFVASPQRAVDLRMFLFFSVQLRGLFSGTGHTITEAGDTGVNEYIIPTARLTDLTNCRLVPLNVRQP